MEASSWRDGTPKLATLATSNLAQVINNWIGPGHGLSGHGADLVWAGQQAGVDPRVLAAIARKESSSGDQNFAPHNAWGYGVHAGPSTNTFGSYREGALRVAKALADPHGYYKGKGLRSFADVISTYAPTSENNTGLYQQQVTGWDKQMGGDPSNVFGPGTGGAPLPPTVTSMAHGTTGMPGTVGVAGTTPDARMSLLAAVHGLHTPGADRIGLLTQIMQMQGQGAGMPAPASPHMAQPVGATSSTMANASGPFFGQQPGPNNLFGFPTGGVDSGRAFRGGVGGDWGGSMERALALARALGVTPSSEKRSRMLTASGNPSDHWVGSTQSYATDLPTSGAAGDALFARIRQTIGQPIKSGTWNNVNIGGYRYQIGWRVPGHFDHIHVGVKKL